MNAQNLQSSVDCSGQLEPLVEDRNHEISTHCDPDLSLHCVGTRAVVMLDAQMSFDPAEEKFDAPSQLVKHGDGESWDFQVVGQEDELLLGFEIDELHSSQQHWKIRPGFLDRRLANMIALKTGETIDGKRVMTCELKVGFGPGDEERASIGDFGQASEVHVATVHQIERASFEEQLIEPSHVVLARSSHMNACGDWSAQIDLGVHLDSSLGLAEVRPREKRQRQIDRGGIQSVDRVVEFDAKIFAGVERSRLANEALCQIFPNPPVSRFVGFGKCRSGYLLGETKVIESLGTSVETSDDVAQSISRCELGKHHTDELLAKPEVTSSGLGFVSHHDPIESLSVNQIEDLGDDESTGVHAPICLKSGLRSSNASHQFFALSYSSTEPSKS